MPGERASIIDQCIFFIIILSWNPYGIPKIIRRKKTQKTPKNKNSWFCCIEFVLIYILFLIYILCCLYILNNFQGQFFVRKLESIFYPLVNEVAKGYSNATVRLSFRNILVNTLESTSFNGFWLNLVHT